MSNDAKIELKQNWSDFKKQGKECIKECLNKETRKKQIPNMFTASRLLAPFLIIPAALCGNILLTAIFSSMFALTDAVDGFFAKKLNAKSEFGRKLDPISDKAFAGSLLIPLMFINPLTIINFIGEIVIASITINSEFSGNKPFTLHIGKAKTGSLYLTIALIYVCYAIGINPAIINFFIGSTTVLQVLSCYEYYKKYQEQERDKKLAIEEELYQQNKIEEQVQVEEKINQKELTLKEKFELLKEMSEELQYPDEIVEEKVNKYIKK